MNQSCNRISTRLWLRTGMSREAFGIGRLAAIVSLVLLVSACANPEPTRPQTPQQWRYLAMGLAAFPECERIRDAEGTIINFKVDADCTAVSVKQWCLEQPEASTVRCDCMLDELDLGRAPLEVLYGYGTAVALRRDILTGATMPEEANLDAAVAVCWEKY